MDDILYEIYQVQTDFALEVWFSIFCKVRYSNEIHRPNNLMLQTKCQGHCPLGSRKYFKCFTIYVHGDHCKVGLAQNHHL